MCLCGGLSLSLYSCACCLQVLVLDKGVVVEAGPPRELAMREGGAFAKMPK